MIRGWFLPALRWLRIALFLMFDSLASLRPAKRGDAAVVIRLDAIGDFVIWLQSGAADIAIELRRTHPRVILLANAAWAPLAEELHLWDDVIAVEPARFVRSLRYRIRTLSMLRQLGFSTAVQPRAARLFLLEDAIVRVCGASVRTGSQALSANMSNALRSIGDRGYTRIIPVPTALTVHESARGMAFARGFCRTAGAVVPAAQLAPLPEPSILPTEPFIVVAMGAGWSGRQWPIEKFAAVLSELHATHGRLCALVGSAAERPLVARLQQLTTARISDFCGRLSLAQSVRLIGRGELLIANESGPMHIAVWCGTPVVGLVGGGHYGWFAPYPEDFPHTAPMSIASRPMPCFHCNWHCKFDVAPGSAVPCVRDIDTHDVVSRAQSLLDRR
jgi:ADP-heptose:LPS heptosyltransferase